MTKVLTPEVQKHHVDVMQHSKSLLQEKATPQALEAAFSTAPLAIVLQQVFEGAISIDELDSPATLALATYLVGEFANSDIKVITEADVTADPLGVAKEAQEQTAKVAEIFKNFSEDGALEHSAFAGVANTLISYYESLREKHKGNKVELVGNLSVAISVLFTDDIVEELVNKIKEAES